MKETYSVGLEASHRYYAYTEKQITEGMNTRNSEPGVLGAILEFAYHTWFYF